MLNEYLVYNTESAIKFTLGKGGGACHEFSLNLLRLPNRAKEQE